MKLTLLYSSNKFTAFYCHRVIIITFTTPRLVPFPESDEHCSFSPIVFKSRCTIFLTSKRTSSFGVSHQRLAHLSP